MMARMQIRKDDKVNLTDAHKNAQCPKRGECVALVEDSHEFSPSEMAVFAIVDVPKVPAKMLTAFVAADVADNRLNRLLRRRAFTFDLNRWNGKPMTLAEALALKVKSADMFDPDVLGAER